MDVCHSLVTVLAGFVPGGGEPFTDELHSFVSFTMLSMLSLPLQLFSFSFFSFRSFTVLCFTFLSLPTSRCPCFRLSLFVYARGLVQVFGIFGIFVNDHGTPCSCLCHICCWQLSIFDPIALRPSLSCALVRPSPRHSEFVALLHWHMLVSCRT